MKKKLVKKESTERDQFTVVLEDIDSKLGGLKEGQDVIDSRLDKVDSHLDRVEGRLGNVESQLEIFKTEMALIRHRLIGPEEFQALETRVAALEKKIR